MKRSSACTRRLSAGDESASSSAAALIEPSRATCTNASIAVRGGNLRIPDLVQCVTGFVERCRALSAATCLGWSDYPMAWQLQSVQPPKEDFALAQKCAALHIERAFQASSP